MYPKEATKEGRKHSLKDVLGNTISNTQVLKAINEHLS